MMIICDVFSLPISTYLLFSQVRKPVLDILMSLGSWNWLGLVKDKDIFTVTVLAEVEEDEDALEEGWDAI